MTDQQNSASSTQNIVAAINEVSERAQLLVREEIELAKTEITVKLIRLARGIGIAAAAGVFFVFGLAIFLHGLSWFAWFEIGSGTDYFWGFFIVAGLLFLLGALAGYIAARLFKAASPPTPVMAIDEAKRIRETVQSEHPETTI
jgi:Putative Actinobacterial Holin-X, holin superfamily III